MAKSSNRAPIVILVEGTDRGIARDDNKHGLPI